MVISKWAAKNGKRVLLCVASGGTRNRTAFTELPPGEIKKLEQNLYALYIDPVAAREEFALIMLKNRLLHKMIFKNRYVNAFLDAVPGLSEWAILGKATFYICSDSPAFVEYYKKNNKAAIKNNKSDIIDTTFDLVVFDSPATGHGLDMLRLPSAIVSSVKNGHMRDEAQARLLLMEDKNRTAVLPVTIPEQMPVNETIELIKDLKKYKIPVYAAIINKVLEPLIDERCFKEITDLKYKGSNWANPAMVYHKKVITMQENMKEFNNFAQSHNLKTAEFKNFNSNPFSADNLNYLTEQFSKQFN